MNKKILKQVSHITVHNTKSKIKSTRTLELKCPVDDEIITKHDCKNCIKIPICWDSPFQNKNQFGS